MTSSQSPISNGFERRLVSWCVALTLGFAASTQAQESPERTQANPVDVSAWGDVEHARPDQPDGDVVESIDLGEGSPPAAPDEDVQEIIALDGESHERPNDVAPDKADEESAFQFRGWARMRLSQARLHDPSTESDTGLEVPFEPTLSDHQLLLELRYEYAHRFEALASGLLWYTLARHQEHDERGGTEDSARGLFEPSLREAYLGVHGSKASLRVGQQRIAWGNADAFAINDVVNPRDLRDPVLAESEVFHVPSFAGRLDLSTKAFALQILVLPFFRPDRIDVYGTNWALIGPDAPAGMRGAFRRLSETVDPSLREPSQLILRQTSLPEDNLRALGLGSRLDYTLGDVNVSHYYHYGYTFSPALTIAPALQAQIAATDWAAVDRQALGPLLSAAGTDALRATYVRRHHVGASLQTDAGPLLLRIEGAYESAQVFTTQSLLGASRPVAQAVFGLEYQPGEPGKAVIFEGGYQRILGSDPGPLLGARVQVPSAALVLRWTFFEHLECELRAMSTLAPRGALLRPQLAYKNEAWELRVGALWLDGEQGSQQHYFRRNASAYAMAKRLF